MGTRDCPRRVDDLAGAVTAAFSAVCYRRTRPASTPWSDGMDGTGGTAGRWAGADGIGVTGALAGFGVALRAAGRDAGLAEDGRVRAVVDLAGLALRLVAFRAVDLRAVLFLAAVAEEAVLFAAVALVVLALRAVALRAVLT
jgi:hypothetical protein